jgi:radical SAM superfamily enzyme YgiQ (UPF0313 family)
VWHNPSVRTAARVRIVFIRPRLGVGTSINQPLHFLYMAAALREAGVADCRIIDAEPYQCSDNDILQQLAESAFDVVAFTAMTVDLPAVARLSARVRERHPNSWMWCGGSHASGDPEATLRALPAIDLVVKGEGEHTSVELCRRFLDGSRDPKGVLGVWYRAEDGELRHNPDRPPEPDIDRLPMPAWDLIDVRAYYHRVRRMGILYRRPAYMSLFTSRACPYGCTYCHATFGKKFQAHSPARVLAEMQILIERYGIFDFSILDDIFNLDRDRMNQICEGIIRRGWKVHLSFPNGIRGDRFDRESLTLLRRAGGWRLNFAPESTSARIQAQIKKLNHIDKLERAIEDASQLGFLTQGNFMLGFPTETYEEMRATVDWSLKSPLHLANYFRVIPLAGTPIADTIRIGARSAAADPTQHDINRTRINLTDVPDSEIERLRRFAYRAFHADPRRLARLARVMPKHPTLIPLYVQDAVARIGGGLTSGNLFGTMRGYMQSASRDSA